MALGPTGRAGQFPPIALAIWGRRSILTFRPPPRLTSRVRPTKFRLSRFRSAAVRASGLPYCVVRPTGLVQREGAALDPALLEAHQGARGGVG